MDCPSCDRENSDGVKFCNECGVSLGASAENTMLPRESSLDSPQSQICSGEASTTFSLAGSTFISRERELDELNVAGGGVLVQPAGGGLVREVATAVSLGARNERPYRIIGDY